MRRLSIIDIQTGHQPISNEEGDVWIVFNGELYNHQDLRRACEARGIVTALIATPRPSFTFMKSMAAIAFSICAECLRLRSGIETRELFSSRATGWASSRSTTV